MEDLLPQFPHLRYFYLLAWGDNDDIVDGYRWQTITSSLNLFCFKLFVNSGNADNVLDSFRTSFWLEERRWFVARQDRCVFSIPYFASNDIDISQPLSTQSTASDSIFLYKFVNKIIINEAEIRQNHFFTNVQTLELKCSIPLEKIESAMDLYKIKCLIVSSLNDLLLFLPLIDKVPRLNELTIENTITSAMIQQIRSHRFDRILKLKISISKLHSHYIIEELFRLFPFIKQIEVTNYVESEKTMIRLIDGFKYLSNASFYVSSPNNDRQFSLCEHENAIIQHSQRLTTGNFTCRIYHSSKNNFLINWWIGEHVCLFHILKLFLIFPL